MELKYSMIAGVPYDSRFVQSWTDLHTAHSFSFFIINVH